MLMKRLKFQQLCKKVKAKQDVTMLRASFRGAHSITNYNIITQLSDKNRLLE